MAVVALPITQIELNSGRLSRNPFYHAREASVLNQAPDWGPQKKQER